MKSKKNFSFLIFCALIAVGIVWTYGTFKAYFETGTDNAVVTKVVEQRMQASHVEMVRLQNQLKDLQFQTAVALGREFKENPTENPLRDKLLQVTRVPASASQVGLSDLAFERAKKLFDAQEWRTSITALSAFVKDYPMSPHIAEAYFLLGESYYKTGKFPLMLDMVETLVSQFPEADVTGFLLLRQAQVSISIHQLDEAQELCRLIKSEYKNALLIEQVDLLEKNIRL
ncbi:MAG: outer membrane protein assembly factor BamD [Bdellovibrionota bacterium]